MGGGRPRPYLFSCTLAGSPRRSGEREGQRISRFAPPVVSVASAATPVTTRVGRLVAHTRTESPGCTWMGLPAGTATGSAEEIMAQFRAVRDQVKAYAQDFVRQYFG